MQNAESTSQDEPGTLLEGGVPVFPSGGQPGWVEPDLDFIRSLQRQGGEVSGMCMQCGTCSATCEVSPDSEPFPRKEMAWATWGMKDRLLSDPDVWLCHQCNDCSTQCPRGARPGQVLAAVRQQCVLHYGFPRFLGRWVSQPECAPFLLGIPAVLLTLALLAKAPIEAVLGISREAGGRIIYSYSSLFPHWLLNTLFGFFSLLALLVMIVGVLRFWRAMSAALPVDRIRFRAKGLGASMLSALRKVVAHDEFDKCTSARRRSISHACVLFGFLALCVVAFWVITMRYNPLIRGEFLYPFGFSNPFKILANLGGAALVIGCLLMLWERMTAKDNVGAGTYFDWALIASLFLVAITGFITEALHFLRLEPHRHIAYFVHLIFALAVFIYLPHSKLAHLFYRFTAMVFAEHRGRASSSLCTRAGGQDGEREGGKDA